jgi:hypothetical protein
MKTVDEVAPSTPSYLNEPDPFEVPSRFIGATPTIRDTSGRSSINTFGVLET